MTIMESSLEKLGIKKYKVADSVGVTPKTLNKWLKYEDIKQVKQFFILCEKLDLSVTEVANDIFKDT